MIRTQTLLPAEAAREGSEIITAAAGAWDVSARGNPVLAWSLVSLVVMLTSGEYGTVLLDRGLFEGSTNLGSSR